MLTSMRNAASNWLGRIVLGIIMSFLVVSFAIWGIGDIFRGYGNATVASIGGVEIGAETFRRLYVDELQRWSQRLRQPITNEQARLFGLDRQLLNRLIAESALDAKARDLDLTLDDATVIRTALADPVFQGPSGAFDRQRFDALLRSAGLTEAGFVQEQRRTLLRRQMQQSFAGPGAAPQVLTAAVDRYSRETRDLRYLRLTPIPNEDGATPDEAALKAFFEERKASFRTRENRKASFLSIGAEEFLGELTITEADVRRVYDRAVASGRLGTPEKRRIEQLLFDTVEQAAEAKARLGADFTFDQLMAERKVTPADADLGPRARDGLSDEMANAAFGLALNAVSEPVLTAFGAALFRVSAIEPAAVLSFESVRASLEPEAKGEKLANDPKVREGLDALFKAIEDQRLAGKSLAEIAASQKRNVAVFDGLEADGALAAGGRADVPGGAEALRAVFASDIGLDNPALAQPDGGHVWFEVNGVTPARDQTFEEARAQIDTAFKEDRRNKALGDRAADIVAKINGGMAIGDIAAGLGLGVEQANGLTRRGTATIGSSARDAAFAIPVGKATSAQDANGTDRLVIVVENAAVPPFDANTVEAKQLAKQLGETLAEDILNQYVTRLRGELGVSINERALGQAVGLTPQ